MTIRTMIRSYTELERLQTFEDRFGYLALRGQVGEPTFGYDRYINQRFYRSKQWKDLRSELIVRDYGCDLGIEGFEIYDKIIIHHMNPMTVDDIVTGDDSILDPEYLICVTLQTHNAIHYGDARQLPRRFSTRTRGDTNLWTRRS
jgi:hypothetical protein